MNLTTSNLFISYTIQDGSTLFISRIKLQCTSLTRPIMYVWIENFSLCTHYFIIKEEPIRLISMKIIKGATRFPILKLILSLQWVLFKYSSFLYTRLYCIHILTHLYLKEYEKSLFEFTRQWKSEKTFTVRELVAVKEVLSQLGFIWSYISCPYWLEDAKMSTNWILDKNWLRIAQSSSLISWKPIKVGMNIWAIKLSSGWRFNVGNFGNSFFLGGLRVKQQLCK